MKERNPKVSIFSSERSYWVLPLILTILSLCIVSFFFGGAFYSEKGKIWDKVVQIDTSQVELNCKCERTFQQEAFAECNITMQDLTPCTDPKRWKRYDAHRMAFRERHCPSQSERLECLVPPPVGYKAPFLWPKSRDVCWYRNVPYDWINTQKSNQNWLRKKGEVFVFPGGGTMFPNGVGEYLDQMQELIPYMKNGSIRTALDTGCGVASWGAYLLDRGILTMSLAPRDNHEAQVQFALERGVPAMLGILATQRLPYPANAFDMAHCSRCLIPWAEFGGIFLLEVDRVLRPGGFWVLSGPPINYEIHWKGWDSTEEKQKAVLDAIQDLMSKMCYKLYAMKGDIAVWQKPVDNSCYESREPLTLPPVCDDSVEPDAAWYVPMRPCIVPRPSGVKNVAIGTIPKWPERLTFPPERLKYITHGSSKRFKADSQLWTQRVTHYKSLLPALGSDKIRNVMDMNTLYGGFAAALVNDPVWVMNVVSSYSANSLGVVYDRGLIGTLHDWCEAFSTYPRTYDLLYVDGLFDEESHRCDIKFVLLEMDRILRPTGYTIIRASRSFLGKAQAIGKAMRWKCHHNETENGSTDSNALLICQKSFWESSKVRSQEG